MINYELMFILRPDLGERDTGKELDEIRNQLASEGAKITHEDLWGVRELAYRIKKEEEGYYAIFNFDLEGSKVSELEKWLNIHQPVLRYLITKTPEGYSPRSQKEYEVEAKVFEEVKPKKMKPGAPSRPARPAKPERKTETKAEEKATEKPADRIADKSTEKPASKPIRKDAETKEVEEKTAKKSKREEKSALDEVDEKLRSIIDDPDISL